MPKQSNILKAFDKQELVDICNSLKLDVTCDTQAREMLSMIVKAVRLYFTPKLYNKVTLEFLLTYNVIDEAGNLLEEDPSFDDDTIQDELKECFGFFEMKDYGCAKCIMKKDCRAKRLQDRPDCFGRYYDPNADECKACIEAEYCKQDIEALKQ